MKTHSTNFKANVKEMGRQLKATITYGNTVLEEELYSVTPLFQANLLKSVMKQLDIETSVEIPIDTVINCQIGLLINDNYEMLDYGNYVVYKVEKQEDTDLYKITCYDKMLYAMKQNEDLGIEYPITIKNYLNALATKIGLEVENTNFYNYSMQIPAELYVGLEYTYRDILDEIAQATGSMIIINSQDKIEVTYPTETNDTIDEEYLKDVNVDFGQKYGPINSIVLSRAGESDNVYLRDEGSVVEDGLCEIKIIDNQIMNFNNRSDFLQGILDALDGLEYYINDFSSTGIMYYEPGDFYNVQVGNIIYKCLMLNDEIKVTTGIEELIHTDMPEQGETDYSKADKTDMRINQTYLIVDKQNQAIEGVITSTAEQNEKIVQIRADLDELSSVVSEYAGVTVYGESNIANVFIENVNVSEPVEIKIHPLGTVPEQIKYLYPRNNLYPSDDLYMLNRVIRFTRYVDGEQQESVDYELPDDLLSIDGDTYDEFYLNYESQTCQITKRCKLNANGEVVVQTEQTTDYEYPTISLDEGDYRVTIPGYEYTYLYVKLMAKNVYTDQFATRAEVRSSITQTAQEINLGVDAKLTNYATTTNMNSAINQKADQITTTVSQTYETKANATTNYSQLTQTAQGLQTQVNGKVGNDEVISRINQSSEEIAIEANKISLARKNNKNDNRRNCYR